MNIHRRKLLGAGAAMAASFAVSAGSGATMAQGPGNARPKVPARKFNDTDILNFALNLEYLEAAYYSLATGIEMPFEATVFGGSPVPFQTPAIKAYAIEIAEDENAHVKFLRAALGRDAVEAPPINLRESFTAAAVAAGLIQQGQTFNPFADEVSFLLGAFIFEDVGVTAYKGASPFIEDKGILEAAAGLLGTEAYHAGIVRTTLFRLGQIVATQKISDARDSLDGPGDLDQGLDADTGNIVPTDHNGLIFSRTFSQVLRIVYLTPNLGVRKGGFFPFGIDGRIHKT